jgi:transcriptional regulator of met regulon
MHKIDIHNYEAYLLDYSEGNLTGELQVELELFLIQHPEFEINLDELSLLSLEDETTTFSNKNALKKTDSDLVCETQFIAYIEKQLPETERLELEKSCSINPTLSKELALYVSTLSAPDTSIVFENKRSLKRKPKVIWFNFSATQYATAACVAFLIGLFILWPKTDVDSGTSTLADKTEVVNTNTIVTNNNSKMQSTIHTNDVITPKESNASMAKQTSTQGVNTIKKEETLLANNNSLQQTTPTLIKDTIHHSINSTPPNESAKNETLIALNVTPIAKPKTVVQVITENDDDLIAANTEKKKKGIWAAASRALKNLNHAGVKTVNGNEEDNTDNTAYAITLGGVSITHKAGL